MGTAPVSSWARDAKGTSPTLRFLIARMRLEDEDSGGDTASPAGHVAGPCSSPAKHFALHKTGAAALQPATGLSQPGEVGTRQPPRDTRVTETPRQESQEAACGHPALGRGTKNGVTCDGHGAGGPARAPTFTPALLGPPSRLSPTRGPARGAAPPSQVLFGCSLPRVPLVLGAVWGHSAVSSVQQAHAPPWMDTQPPSPP